MPYSRSLFAVVGLILALVAASAFAEIKEGRDYALLARIQPTDAKDKIEVTEFFWYGCPHCYDFEPVLSKWIKKLPKDVVFRRVHADFGRWTPGAKLFYALDAIGEENRVHEALFDAIQKERIDYENLPTVADWLAKKGVDRKKFTEAYNSFSVNSKVQRAQQLTRSHGLNGVPSVVVGGKYLTTNIMAGSFEALAAVMDELIVKARADKGRK